MKKRKVEITESNLKELNQMIDEHADKYKTPCKKGCSYCCHQVISIYDFERIFIRDAIRKLSPEIKEKVKENFFKAKDHITKCTPPDIKEVEFRTFQDGYGKLMAADFISCPLLVDNLCAIYEDRPLACRTHFVLDEPMYCAMNRVRDACDESIKFSLTFSAYLVKSDLVPELSMLMTLLKDFFDRKGKMITIKKAKFKK